MADLTAIHPGVAANQSMVADFTYTGDPSVVLHSRTGVDKAIFVINPAFAVLAKRLFVIEPATACTRGDISKITQGNNLADHAALFCAGSSNLYAARIVTETEFIHDEPRKDEPFNCSKT